MLQALEKTYGHLFDSQLLLQLLQVGSYRDLKAGAVLFESGKLVKQIPLLLEGSIKIIREYEDGGSLLLHYIEKGDAGTMLMTQCWDDQPSEVRAIAELDSTMLMIPKRNAQQWMSQYPDWQRFILANHGQRMKQVVDRLEAVAFRPLEENLTFYLTEKKRIHRSSSLQLTHEEIAQDLRTSRVVISRMLKQMERNEKLALHRSRIELNAPIYV